MKGRVRYIFEIATRSGGGDWQIALSRTGEFTREPKATARSIVERWIFEQAGQLRGGRVIIRGARTGAPRAFDATVRVRILAGDGSGRQLAAAFVGSDVSIGARVRRRLGAVLGASAAHSQPLGGSDVDSEPAAARSEQRDEYTPPPLALVGQGRA